MPLNKKLQNSPKAKTLPKKGQERELKPDINAIDQPLDLLLQQAGQLPGTLNPAAAAQIQRSIGNQAMGRLGTSQTNDKPPTATSSATSSLQRILEHSSQVVSSIKHSPSRIQPKLTLGPVGDKYEQEADQVARQIVSHVNGQQPASDSQRQADEDELAQMKPDASLQRQEEEEALQAKPVALMQRQEEEEEIQMKPADLVGGGPVSTDLESQIQSSKHGGQFLSENIRQPMEEAFGADFSGVKIHTGSQSDNLNQSIQARAFTTGQDIFFRQGEYDPGSTSGQELLAHELTHVVQQNGPAVQRKRVEAQSPPQPGDHVIQREGEELAAQQQMQVLATPPTSDANGGGQDDWTPVRQAVQQVAMEMEERAASISAFLTEIKETVASLPVGGPAIAKAMSRLISSEDEIRAEVDKQLETGRLAAGVVSAASDADMMAVMGDVGITLAIADEAMAAVMRALIPHAQQAARIAADAKAPGLGAEIVAQADILHDMLERRQTLQYLIGARQARGRKRDAATDVIDVADVINNIGGVSAGIAGIIEALGVKGASGGAIVGTLGGVLGIVFGSIGLILGLYAVVTGAMKKKALKKIAPHISNEVLSNINEYAQIQKEKAMLGGTAVAIIGAAAIGAGVLGLIALSVTTFGAAAIVAGIAAALMGLGLVAYKAIHARSKRRAERRAFAEGMVTEIQLNGPKAAEFRFRIQTFGLNPDDALGDEATQQALINNLTGKVGDLVKSERQQVAESLIDFLINGKPSEQYDSELIIKALGRDPQKVRERVANGDLNTEVSRIMAKLSSW